MIFCWVPKGQKNQMINRKFLFFLFLAIINLLSLPFDPRDTLGSTDGIIAIVNEDLITKSELNSSKIFPHKSISFLIEKKIQLQTANKMGIGVNPTEISAAMEDIKKENSFLSDKDFETALLKQGISLKDYKKDLKEQLILIKLINREIKSKITITDSELEEYYSLNKRLFSSSEEIRIGYIHIPVKTTEPVEIFNQAQNKIRDILLSFKKEVSFSDIKRNYSGQPEIIVSEDLGFIKKGELLQELNNTAFALREGEITDVISTPTGFYILKMLERKEIEYIPFKDVKDMVREMVFQEKSEKRVKEWIYELKSASYIDIKI